MKLQWLWRMQCHITSSLILEPPARGGPSSAWFLGAGLPASDCYRWLRPGGRAEGAGEHRPRKGYGEPGRRREGGGGREGRLGF
uniref:Uncharacterized protein n=1 Tax=Arundo donax TaxID=35708 RepID=A0A0A9GY39_ARUDO